MRVLSVLSLYNGIVFLAIAVYVLLLNPKGRLNRIAALLNFSFFLWSAPVAFFYQAQTKAEAWTWLKLSSLGWCTFAVFTLHFILVLTGRDAIARGPLRLVRLYAVPAVFVATTLFFPGTPLAADITQSSIGWGWTNTTSPLSLRWITFAVYIAGYVGSGLLLLPGWAKKSRNEVDKRTARSILWTDCILMPIGFITDILMPVFTTVFPPVANILSLFFAITFSRYVLRYSFLSRSGIITSDQILETILAPVILLDSGGRIIRCNEETTHLTGKTADQLLEREFAELLRDGRYREDRLTVLLKEGKLVEQEAEVVHASGESRFIVYTAMTMQDENLGFVGTVITAVDITEPRQLMMDLEASRNQYREAAEDLYRIAHYDTLTGLPNRRLFFQRVMENFVAYELNGTGFAIVFMDLNGFKQVNDDYGHDVGDQLLVESASRLQEFAGKTDLLARMGGDEFVMILSGVTSRDEALARIHAIKRRFRDEIRISGIRCDIGIAAGLSLYPEQSDLNAMLRVADEEMYEDKRREKEEKKKALRKETQKESFRRVDR